MKINSSDFKFNFWVNFWYSCIDSIFLFIIENIIEDNIQRITSKNENVIKYL